MPSDVIFPTGISNGTPATDDRILFSDTSASNATKDCALSELPISDDTQTALDLKVDKTITVNGNALSANVTLTQDDIGDGTSYKQYSSTEKTKLAGIETGAEVNNISDVNVTDLTDGGDSALHYHSTDRARANHTGTQTASTISDFDTEVSNNTDVTANTSARHTHTNKTILDNTTASFTSTEQTKLAGIETGAEVNTVDSVNSQTGTVVLDADDIDDSSTTNKFVTSADITKLGNLSGTNTGDITVTDSSDIDLTLVGQNIQADLITTGVTPGSYTLSAITVDSKGRITSASNGSLGGTPLTTKGDLLTYDTGDARLPVGTNGQVLTADSAETTGIKWATPAGGGDVVGPASAVDNDIAVFDGTTGKLIKDGTKTITQVLDTDNHTSGTINKVYTSTEQTKLAGIETGAEVNDIVGPTTSFTVTDNDNGTATITTCNVRLNSATDYTGVYAEYTITGDTFTFTDGTEEYIVADYNAGSPIFRKETDKTLINGSSIVTMAVCWRTGTTVHQANEDGYGLGLVNKINRAMYNTEPYKRSIDGGLIITESVTPNPRTILVSESVVYTGHYPQTINSFNSSTDKMTEVYHVSGVWTYTDRLVYGNQSYDDGTDKTTMALNKYACRWFYRSIGDVKQVFYVNGGAEYNTLALAELELPRTDLPTVLRDHCMLVGRAIIQYNATSGVTTSSFGLNFVGTAPINHNDTGNIQGGTTGEEYHLTSAQHTALTAGFTGTGNLVRETSPTLVTPLLGTPTSGTLTNCTGLPLTGLVDDTTTALGVGTLELGHASDTTISRVSAGVIAVEGTTIPTNDTAVLSIAGTPSGGDRISRIISLTSAEYAAISGSEVADTLYIITDA